MCGPAVADGQADPGPLGVGVEVGGPLAGQVGQEEQPLAPGPASGRLVGQEEIGIDPLLLGRVDLGLAQLVAEPLEAAAGREHDAHDVPGARHRVAAALEPARAGRSRARSAWAKTTPEVPIVAETTPGRTIPLPTAPAGWSPPPPTTGVPAARPVAFAPSAAHLGRDLGALVARGQERRVELELAQQLAGSSGGWPRRA